MSLAIARRHGQHSSGSWFWVFLVALALLLSPRTTALAQEQGLPTLRITRVETANFPEVKVYVLGQNLGADLSTISLSLEQDGVNYPTAEEMSAMGTQIAIVLDASENIRQKGLTGDPRYIEVGNVVTRLIARNQLEAQRDWLAAFVPDRDNRLTALKDWTRDHVAVANEIYLFQPIQGIGNTALFNLIFNTLNQYERADIDPALQRVMVVFSDGIDVVSGLQLEDVVSLAREKGVTIYTVMLGPSKPQTRSNLERIALRTGGQYHELTSLDALDSMWDKLIAGRSQKVLSYRSQTAAPQTVRVTATLPDGRTVEASRPFPSVNLAPVQIRVVQPPAGFVLVRRSDFYETPLEDLEPKVLPIALEFNWLNNAPRALRRVEYTINDDTRIVEQEPFDQFIFPVERLEAGNYTLRVVAVDELNLQGRADPLPFSVQINQPPAPTATPVTIVQEQVQVITETIEKTSWASYAALAIGLLSLLLALIVFFRKPERREMVKDALSEAWKAATQPFAVARRDGQHEEIKAQLVVVEGPSSISSPIPIRGSKLTIGRDPTLANLSLPDQRVSRYHCRISEGADGQFYIYDEGSTSGTYINYEYQVGMGGYALQPNDLINVGPVTLRFELLSSSDGTVPYQPSPSRLKSTTTASASGGNRGNTEEEDDPDRTEPFAPQFPKSS